MLFWLTLVVVVVLPLGGLLYAAVKGLGLWRTVRAFLRALGAGVDELGARVDALAAHEPPDTEPLAASAERLRRSWAQLSLLLTAVRRVREQATGYLALYPRK